MFYVNVNDNIHVYKYSLSDIHLRKVNYNILKHVSKSFVCFPYMNIHLYESCTFLYQNSATYMF